MRVVMIDLNWSINFKSTDSLILLCASYDVLSCFVCRWLGRASEAILTWDSTWWVDSSTCFKDNLETFCCDWDSGKSDSQYW